jgi:ankyrin repeat protein
MALLLGCVVGLPLVVQALQPDPAGAPMTIFQAAEAGNVSELRRLLSRGGTGAAATEETHGYTPLMLAAQRGNCQAMAILLDAGADPNAQTRAGQSSLGIAAAWGQESAVRYLLSRGARPSGVTRAHRVCDPPLVSAARSGMSTPQILELLIQAGADVNQADDEGTTPLMAAQNARLDECVDVLIRAGAKVRSNDER